MEAGSPAELVLPPALSHREHTLKVNLQYRRLHKCVCWHGAGLVKIDELVSLSFLYMGLGMDFVGPLRAFTESFKHG